MQENNLYIAARDGDIKTVKVLLENGVNPNIPTQTDSFGRSLSVTPLYSAAFNGHYNIVCELLPKMSVDAINHEINEIGTTALSAAAEEAGCGKDVDEEMLKIVDALIKAGARFRPDENIKKGEVLLFRAAERGYVVIVRALHAKGVRLDSHDPEVGVLLIEACRQGLTLRLSAALDVTSVSEKVGGVLLEIAAAEEQVEIVRVVLAKVKGAKVDSIDSRGYTPLLTAAEKGNLAIVCLLLDAGADVNKAIVNQAENKNGPTPLFLAVQNHHFVVAQELLNRGADVSAMAHFRDPAKPRGGWVFSVADLVMRKGVDPALKDLVMGHLYLTFLCQGILTGDAVSVREDVSNVTEVNRVYPREGLTPLYLAVLKGRIDIVQLLLNRKADPRMRMIVEVEHCFERVKGQKPEVCERLNTFLCDTKYGFVEMSALNLARIMGGEESEIFKLLNSRKYNQENPQGFFAGYPGEPQPSAKIEGKKSAVEKKAGK